MSAPERTRQQLDPIGTFGSNAATILYALLSFGFSAGVVLRDFDRFGDSSLTLVALLFLGISCAYLVFASNSIRAPFTRQTMAVILFIALVACAFETVAQWGDAHQTLGGWGPLALGFLLLAMGPYRPPREIAAAGSIVAIFFGFLIVVQAGSPVLESPVLAIVAVSIMPILALGYAAAAHSKEVVDGLERWHRRMMGSGRVVTREDEMGIARSVQQDRVTILNRDVLPFFLEIIDKPTVSNADRERARDIAASVRKVMVAEVDRSWLEQAVDTLAPHRSDHRADAGTEPVVRDDDRVANHMSYDQRTALRAVIVALHEGSARASDFMKVELYRDGGAFRVVMVAELEVADFTVRTRFAPYFAVLRVMFSELRLEYLHGVLTLSFSYEQR